MRTLLLILLLLTAVPGWSQRDYTATPDAERSDLWYDPTDPGWAIAIAPSGAISSALLIDFDAAGAPRWWFGGAMRDGPGRVSMSLHRPRWDLQRQRLAGSTHAGQLQFTRSDEDHAALTLELDGRQRQHALRRYVVNRDYSLGDRSGFWFDPDEGGHGQMLLQHGDWLGSISLGYDRTGEPAWAFAQGTINSGTLVAQRVERICDPQCRLHFSAGGATYLHFDDQDQAHATITLADSHGEFWSRLANPLRRYTLAPINRAHPSALARFGEPAALADFLDQAVSRNPYYGGSGCIDFSPSPPPVTTASETNNQESGVGEHDRVKRIGDRVYAISDTYATERQLRVHTLQGDRGTATALDSYPLPPGLSAIGLHARVDAAGARVILLAGRSPYGIGYTPWCGYEPLDGHVLAIVYAVASDGRLQEQHRIELEGSFVTSRLLDAQLLIASVNVLAREADGQVGLPRWRIDGGDWRPMAELASIWLPNLAPAVYERSLLTLSRFNLDALSTPQFASVFAPADLSYVSSTAWYFGTTEYRWRENAGNQGAGGYEMDIHKLALDDLSYRGTGTVPGTVGASAFDRSFRLSEHNGDLRVITDHSWEWQASTLFELSILREDRAALKLRTIASLPNAQRPQAIGPPHEQAYGVRFVGDAAYAVSFYRVDPLYAIDLSDPLDPKLDSALEISGYSAYLHPLPGNFLLGVGLDAVPGTNGDAPGFAWFQGLKLSLFDQRDPQSPSESWRQVIGQRGSSSALLHDHRAFAAATTPEGHQRIAVPIVVHDGAGAEPWSYRPWHYTGVASFDVTSDGRILDYRLRPAVYAGTTPTSAYDLSANVMLYGDSIFLFSGGHWYGARSQSTAAMSGPY